MLEPSKNQKPPEPISLNSNNLNETTSLLHPTSTPPDSISQKIKPYLGWILGGIAAATALPSTACVEKTFEDSCGIPLATVIGCMAFFGIAAFNANGNKELFDKLWEGIDYLIHSDDTWQHKTQAILKTIETETIALLTGIPFGYLTYYAWTLLFEETCTTPYYLLILASTQLIGLSYAFVLMDPINHAAQKMLDFYRRLTGKQTLAQQHRNKINAIFNEIQAVIDLGLSSEETQKTHNNLDFNTPLSQQNIEIITQLLQRPFPTTRYYLANYINYIPALMLGYFANDNYLEFSYEAGKTFLNTIGASPIIAETISYYFIQPFGFGFNALAWTLLISNVVLYEFCKKRTVSEHQIRNLTIRAIEFVFSASFASYIIKVTQDNPTLSLPVKIMTDIAALVGGTAIAIQGNDSLLIKFGWKKLDGRKSLHNLTNDVRQQYLDNISTTNTEHSVTTLIEKAGMYQNQRETNANALGNNPHLYQPINEQPKTSRCTIM